MNRGEEHRTLRLLLVDDSESYRAALAKLLSREKDVTVVAEASNGRTAIEQTLKHRPNVIIMDIMMPGKG